MLRSIILARGPKLHSHGHPPDNEPHKASSRSGRHVNRVQVLFYTLSKHSQLRELLRARKAYQRCLAASFRLTS
jgi:hypothetical protein